MNRSRLLHAALVGLGLLVAAPLDARVLDLDELFVFGGHLDCVEACPVLPAAPTYDDYVTREQCLAACGYAPRAWEKNGIAPIDRADWQLALFEHFYSQETGPQAMCYRDQAETVVAPGPFCVGTGCELMATVNACDDETCAAAPDVVLDCTQDQPGGPRCWLPEKIRPAACPDAVCERVLDPVDPLTFSASQCADGDGDGLPAWVDGDDAHADALCGGEATCGFPDACVYDAGLGAGTCQARACGETCTAFHLELVAEDDVEVIVHVHYDGSPVPARALTLYLTYDPAALLLEDARPLALLSLAGKQLASSHLSDGTLRLDVFDPNGTHPIPQGPIVELVFQRMGGGATTVAFSKADELQQKAIAPLQGNQATQHQLTADALWGAAITLRPAAEVETKLRLWYGFESLDRPLTYAATPTADELCGMAPDCANAATETAKASLLARLEALQAGDVFSRRSVAGPSGAAAYLDGSSDHLRLPVQVEQPLVPRDQSFSFSTWFYSEGNSAAELKQTPQVLFSHNAPNERTAFGLLLQVDDAGALGVSFFDGDLLSQSPAPAMLAIAEEIPLRTWHHVGFSLDADSGLAALYYDGRHVAAYQFQIPPAAVSCPTLVAGRDVLLHDEGDVLGGRAPEFLLAAVRRSNLYGLERLDPSGQQATTILRDGQYSYRDPDYYAGLDRVVFASNRSGDVEIWMAKGDGTGAQQLTTGFGDADRGIAARRPRWAPDGSAIVFESNIYDLVQGDNSYARVSHLYYLGYDPEKNEPAVELADGTVVDRLDYPARLADQTINDFRLTSGAVDRQHKNARWLRGRDPATGSHGELLVDTASPGLKGHRVARVLVPDVIAMATTEELPGLGEADQELRLVTAWHGEKVAFPAPVVTERLLYQRGYSSFQADPQFALTVEDDPGEVDAPGRALVTIVLQPSGYDAACWDRNRDGLADADEDRNHDGAWTQDDCLPYDVAGLFVEYDADRFRPVLEDADGTPMTPGSALTSLGKSLKLQDVYPQGRAFVRVEVTSPLDATPLPSGGEIATLRFERLDAAAPGVPFGVFERQAVDELVIKDLQPPYDVTIVDPAGRFERLDDAAFSPDGDRLVLGVVSQARPMLLRTAGLDTAAGADRILAEPRRLEGFDWVRQARYYPCNWAGGYVHFQNKLVQDGLRGGLDELKLHAGVRDPDSFRSEAERGREGLAHAGLAGQVDSLQPTCTTSHLECPAFHLCVAGECQVVPCDPDDPYACSDQGGRCTLRPLSVEQEATGAAGSAAAFDWVCTADCAVDQQCFSQECLNGPCRYCERGVCVECRDVVRELGALTFATLEGCPDRRSFSCEAGACLTECYAFEDDASVYLCDPTLEYCKQGRCELLDWTWWDLAPISFAGLAGTHLQRPPSSDGVWPGTTMSVDQRVPIRVWAYGVSDFGQAPEVVVEVNGGPIYGGDWHRVGRIAVHHERRTPALARPYVLSSPYPFEQLRLRLVTGPYQNLTGGSTGLRENDKDFCYADYASSGGDFADAAEVCNTLAQGSRYSLGYTAEVTPYEAIASCRAQGKDSCASVAQGEHDFLRGGNPAVVVLDVEVDGASVNLVGNPQIVDTVCAYEGALVPRSVDGAPKKLVYGSGTSERSAEKVTRCDPNQEMTPAWCGDDTGLLPFDRALYGYALLNCNAVDPATGEGSELRIPVVNGPAEWPARQGAIVLDNGDTCTVELDALRVESCYAWMGDDVGFDPYGLQSESGAFEAFASLDVGLLRSFGHGDGFTSQPLPRFPLSVMVKGLTGEGLQVTLSTGDGDETLAVTAVEGQPVTLEFATQVKLGKRYELAVASQPTGGGPNCVVSPALQAGAMPNGGLEIPVLCVNTYFVQGAIQGLAVTTPPDVAWTPLVLRNDSVDDQGAPFAVDEASIPVNETTGDNQTFRFPIKLPVGAAYDVSVVAHPVTRTGANPEQKRCVVANGTGTVGEKDVSNVQVTCKKVIPHALSVSVSGLVGQGLTLKERETGQLIPVLADGATAFPAMLVEGDSYDIVVVDQPSDPFQACNLASSGAGAMPDAAHVGASVTCTTLPTWQVEVQVAGLLGDGLMLALDTPYGTEGLEVTPGNGPDELSLPMQLFFQTELLNGDDYSVILTAQPTAPDQKCTVAAGQGTMNDGRVLPVVVVCGPVFDTTTFYTLGGRVYGLEGSGLRLGVNMGTQTVTVDEKLEAPEVDAAGNALPKNVACNADPTCYPFVFPNMLGDYMDYAAYVDRNPVGPSQACTVTANDQGQIASADVTDIEVTCETGARIVLDVVAPEADTGHIKALLVSADGKKVLAKSPKSSRLKDGKLVVTLLKPGTSSEAVLLPGTYRLYVKINRDSDTSMGSMTPFYEPSIDWGLVQTVTVSAAEKIVIKVDEESPAMTPLMSAGLFLMNVPTTTDAHASFTCYWTPAAYGEIAGSALPPAADVPVIGVGRHTCDPSGDPCVVFPVDDDGNPAAPGHMVIQLEDSEALPPGGMPYSATCWIDVDNDGQFDSGSDLKKYVPNALPGVPVIY